MEGYLSNPTLVATNTSTNTDIWEKCLKGYIHSLLCLFEDFPITKTNYLSSYVHAPIEINKLKYSEEVAYGMMNHLA